MHKLQSWPQYGVNNETRQMRSEVEPLSDGIGAALLVLLLAEAHLAEVGHGGQDAGAFPRRQTAIPEWGLKLPLL